MSGSHLQPLRIPAGWLIQWNTLEEIDPEQGISEGYGGSSIFLATNETRRFRIDVEWRPEFDPEGRFHMRVDYAPWERTDRGARRSDLPLHFRHAELIHEYATRSQAELVRELDAWLWRCAIWMREGH